METNINDNGIDKDKWDKVQPLLKKAWDECVATGRPMDDFVGLVVPILSPGGQPYFEKFLIKKIEAGEPLLGQKEEDKDSSVKVEAIHPDGRRWNEAPEAKYPFPDRSKLKPNFSMKDRDDQLDIHYIEGIFDDGRPFRMESWASGGFSYATFYLSRKGVENFSPADLKEYLKSNEVIEFDDRLYLNSGFGDSINLSSQEKTDTSGNPIFEATVIVGDEDGTYVHFPIRWGVKNKNDWQLKEYEKEASVDDAAPDEGELAPLATSDFAEPVDVSKSGSADEKHQSIEESQAKDVPEIEDNYSVAETILEDAINDLRDIGAERSGDDSPLSDHWERIKDQVQHEKRISWPVYVEMMEVAVKGNVEALSEVDREILAEGLDVSSEKPTELYQILLELLLKRAGNEKIRYKPFHFTYFRYPVEGFDVYAQILERTGLYQFRIAGYSVAVPDGEEGEMSTHIIEDTMSKEEFELAGQMNWPEDWEEAKACLSDVSEPEDEDDLQDQAEEEAQLESSNIEKAISLAVEGHKGQEDKAGAPYILHPLRIMFKMDGEEKMISAVLHDLIEDTHISLDDLKEHGFDNGIIEAVDSVTKRNGEDYREFIDRAGLHPIGADIKMADLEDNMDLSRIASVGDRDLKRLNKYHRAMGRMRELEAIRKEPIVVRYYKEGGKVQVATVILVPRGMPNPYNLNAYGSAGTIVIDFSGPHAEAVMPENFLDLRRLLKTGDPQLLYHSYDMWAPFFCPECGACYTDNEWDIQMNGFGYCPQGHRRKIMKVELNLEDSREIELRLERGEAASTSHKRSNKSGSQDRYETVGNYTVRDHQTGLEWVSGPDKDTDWNQAKAWVETLQVDGSGWRMPSVAELKCLFGEDFWNRQMNPILRTTGSFVWSRETVGLTNAKGFSLSDGNCNWNCMRGYANRCRAFAVRFRGGGEAYTLHPQPALKTNGFQGHYEAIGNDIVWDKQTDLEWLTGPDKDTTWEEAKAWVKNLRLGGGGWRMPTLNELKELYEKGLGERNMSPLLKSTGWWAWSGKAKDSSYATAFNFRFGLKHWYSCGSADLRAFAVRPRRDV